jgi:hypothetical protein
MCFDGGGSSAPPPQPDYTPIAQSNDKAAQLAYDAADNDLAFRKQVYAESQPRQQQLYDLASQVAKQQLGISDENQAMAREQNQYYKTTYQPIERQTVMDSMQSQYLSSDEQSQLQAALRDGDMAQVSNLSKMAADRASQEQVGDVEGLRDKQLGFVDDMEARQREAIQAQVGSAFDAQSRQLGRMGAGDPNRMGKYATEIGNAKALAQVGGQNQVGLSAEQMRQGIRQTAGEKVAGIKAGRYGAGTALRSGVANFGRNMPNTAGQAYGLATNAGSSATANQNTGFMSGLPYAQFNSGAFGTQLGAAGIGSQAALGMGGVVNQGYATGVSAANAARQAEGAGLAGLGQLGGMALSAGASKPWWLAA